MLEAHQETQSQMHNETLGDVEILAKKPIPSKSKFKEQCQNQDIALQPLPKPRELKPLKQSTMDNIISKQCTQSGLVKIKPKTRLPSLHPDEQSSQQSINPMQPIPLNVQVQQPQARPIIKSEIHSILEQECQSIMPQRQPKQNKKSTIRPESLANYELAKGLANLKQFLSNPLKTEQVCKFTVQKIQHLFNTQVCLRLQGETDRRLISFGKQMKIFGNKFFAKISRQSTSNQGQSVRINQTEPNEKDKSNDVSGAVGVIQSNFNGSIFNIYQNDSVIATIQYCSDVEKNGAPRKIKIYVQSTQTSNQLDSQSQNLKQAYDKNKIIKCLQTKSSVYSKETDTYGLSFNANKLILPSLHNTILVDKSNNDKPVLKLFKSGEKLYELECYAPLNPLIGCAFALSSFSFKLVSQ